MEKYDAVIVGSGPNGYAAGIRLLQEGLSVLMIESQEEIGGGVRSAELTLPGFVHDIGSTVHPLAYASPYLSTLPLHQHGLRWIQPEAPLAHPLEEGEAIIMYRELEKTAAQLGKDEQAYIKLMQSAVDDWEQIAPDFLGPLRWPEHPLKFARFGLRAIQPLSWLNKISFKEEKTKALLAGLSAHAMLPLSNWASSGIAMVLGILAHRVGWPFPEGGAKSLSHALDSYYKSLGGEVQLNTKVSSISDIPPCRAILLDTSPQVLLNMQGIRLPWWYKQDLKRYHYGQGIFKMDWALSEPIPFLNKDCLKAATVHIGPTYEDIARSEREMWQGKHPDKPYVLLVQSSLFDKSRAPEGKHTAWAYCHVPRFSEKDMSQEIEQQIERFAPGFKEVILKRHSMNTKAVQQISANYIGGDINCGAQTINQQFTRPVYRLNPYRTGIKGMYLCSSATPPGGGVHGMSGFHAAETAIRDLKRS
ncbi:phytoene desaturase family protein [Catalinimonas niigatensis]|uniref:phytoene desaturase family protein n=1 Tax=Catalinimonas niigatensis TaxID=1397264 RepID=UPI0026663853|nr:NAD(P)/FAD-dependent oxidoreductase [Catalinimonas niigatensis]WPP49685.1 NAD(P)/FAD-dependent oxidoreductase [Catalinimonas niigatensis]